MEEEKYLIKVKKYIKKQTEPKSINLNWFQFIYFSLIIFINKNRIKLEMTKRTVLCPEL